jgi:hypothetical protein
MRKPPARGGFGTHERVASAYLGAIELTLALLGLITTLGALLLTDTKVALVGIVLTAVAVGMAITRILLT